MRYLLFSIVGLIATACATDTVQTIRAASGSALSYAISSKPIAHPVPAIVVIGAVDKATHVHAGRLRTHIARATGIDSLLIIEPRPALNRAFLSTRSDAARLHASPETILLLELLDSLVRANVIDSSRLYIAGFTGMTFGVWDVLQRRPDLFAAAVPIGSGGDKLLAKRIAKIPLWLYHSSPDMVKALERLGGSPHKTSGKRLGIWGDSVQLTEALEWMIRQRRTSDQLSYALKQMKGSVPCPEVVLPDPRNLHLYLLMGQSNMAGRGKVESQGMDIRLNYNGGERFGMTGFAGISRVRAGGESGLGSDLSLGATWTPKIGRAHV